MRYKKHTVTEISINISVNGITDDEELEETMLELQESLEESMCYDNSDNLFCVDLIDDNLLCMQSDDITPDKSGLETLNIFHEDLLRFFENYSLDVELSINIEYYKAGPGLVITTESEDVDIHTFLENVDIAL